MKHVVNFGITSEQRRAITIRWTLLSAKLLHGGADAIYPADLEGLDPSHSKLVDMLADIAMRPLVERGICQRHERHPRVWFTLRDKSKATALLNELSNS